VITGKTKFHISDEKYHKLMYVLAYNILKNHEDAEDTVIASWEKIICHLDKINEIDCQETNSFFVIVVERTAIDYYKKNKRQSSVQVLLEEYEESPYFATKDKTLENLELYEVLRHIPKKYSEVLLLYYVNGKFRFGYMMRHIAVVVIIILSLFAANEVSARAFGFNAWKYITSFLTDSKMDVKTYTEKRNSTEGTEYASVKRDVPAQIPDGMNEVSFQQDDTSLYVEWSKEEECLQYSRIKLSSDMSLAMDGEYQSKEKIIINDYSGVYYVKGNEAWIAWDDACYNHMIMAIDVDDSKEILIKMAESLYQ
jgi:RNA polymerase sigma-70 factor (ECF subfamily)